MDEVVDDGLATLNDDEKSGRGRGTKRCITAAAAGCLVPNPSSSSPSLPISSLTPITDHPRCSFGII